MIQVQHFLDSIGHLVTEPLRGEHFHVVGIPQQFLLEVEGGPQIKSEDAVLVVAFRLLLRTVNLEVTQVVGLVGFDLNLHNLLVVILITNHADEAVKIGLGIPLPWHREGLVGLLQRQDAVQGANPNALILLAVIAVNNHVPSLAKQLEAQWLHIIILRVVFPIAFVGNVKHPVLLHRLDDGPQVNLS